MIGRQKELNQLEQLYESNKFETPGTKPGKSRRGYSSDFGRHYEDR